MEDITSNSNDDNTAGADNTGVTPDLADRLTHLAMMLRRMDMMGRPGRPFGGMRAGQGRVLHILTLRSPMPQKELAFMLGVRPQSLSELLGKLESAGFVERRRDDTDRRTFIVDITEEGRNAASDVPETDDPFDVLTAEEQEQFGDMLDRVSAAVREKFPDDPRGGGRGRGFGGPFPFGGGRGFDGHRGGRGGHDAHGGHSGHGMPDADREAGDRAHWHEHCHQDGSEWPGMREMQDMGRMAMFRMGMMGRGRGSGRGFGRGFGEEPGFA
ncbi:MarR family winged helix-turn-helix transcriptional regulator [Corynebacterium glyciniphilum]|uniref:MarR family winged helix-turn-helix transcriptional regulator n=1 Tax=Corynebacterium glyciniphilum TaxID=1404244 RepID=UPI0023566382